MKPSRAATALATLDFPAPAGPSMATTIRPTAPPGRRRIADRRRRPPPCRPPPRPPRRPGRRPLPAAPAGDRRGHPGVRRAGRRCRGRRTRRRAPRCSAPSPRSPSTTVAMRSDSLTRSSPAPRTIVSPSAKQPSSATSGSSSMASGTSSAVTSVASMGPWLTSRSDTGSSSEASPAPRNRRPRSPPIRWTIRRKPARVQLTPTPSSTRREPRTITPAAIRNAALDMSPGTVTGSSSSSSERPTSIA